MAFWGVEVKSAKPFTHEYDSSKGRLHISMATLGFGTSTAKSTLQCNVGNRSPVYLCSLYPGNTESLQLNLELEEDDKVIFSVLGPRSIHLCGYYLASTFRKTIAADDESESYGEDIADTETEKSDYSDEDDYDDSFIDDDDDPEVFPPTPISNEEEASRDSRPKGKKGNRGRLRKKYQSVDSDDDGSLEQKIIVNDSVDDQSKEIDNEDGLPISSLYKNKTSQMALFEESDNNIDRGADDAGNMNGEDDRNSNTETNLKTADVFVDCQMQREAELSDHLVDPCNPMDVEYVKKLKKKKKGKGKETKSPSSDQSIKLNNAVQDEPKMDKMTQGFLEVNEHQQQHADDKETEITDKILPSSEVGQGQGKKAKKKRKELSKEGTVFISNDAYHSNPSNLPQRDEHNKQDTVNEDVKISDNVALPSAEMDPDKRKKRRKKEQVNKASHLEGDNGYHQEDNKANGDTAESDNLNHIFSERKEQHHKLANEMSVDDGAHDIPVGNQSEDRKIKKKKKKIKSQGNGEVVNKAAGAEPSQVRKLSNGLVIEELESGTKDGKIAALGKKISIHYTGKLKENGVVFESNAGQAPFKFRLGKGEVIEGWDVGLEGMQVGEKRRLVIPPSMTSKGDGHSDSAKIPPDSWLVYDFELVKVH